MIQLIKQNRKKKTIKMKIIKKLKFRKQLEILKQRIFNIKISRKKIKKNKINLTSLMIVFHLKNLNLKI